MEFVRSAGQVIAEKIRCMDYDSEVHVADLDDLDTETQLAYLPPRLRLLPKSLQSSSRILNLQDVNSRKYFCIDESSNLPGYLILTYELSALE